MWTPSRPDHQDVPGTVAMFFPHQLDVEVLKMAKPGPPGSLNHRGKQNPTPTNLGLHCSARETHTHTHTSVHRVSSRLAGSAAPGSWHWALVNRQGCLPRSSVVEGTFPSPDTSLPMSPFKLVCKLLWTISRVLQPERPFLPLQAG